MKKIDFWFSIGSTYTYLTMCRIDQVEKNYKISFNWKPFSVRKIMLEMNNIPFTPPEKKTKSDYMWRDIERRAIKYGLKPKIPAPYPLKEFDLANKLAILGIEEGWCEDYAKITYKLWFEDGIEAGSAEAIDKTINQLNLNKNEVLEKANSELVRNKFYSQTDVARKLGVFGSPTFIVNKEVFWGDDRLDDAIKWSYGVNI